MRKGNTVKIIARGDRIAMLQTTAERKLNFRERERGEEC